MTTTLLILFAPAIIGVILMAVAITRDTWIGGTKWPDWE